MAMNRMTACDKIGGIGIRKPRFWGILYFENVAPHILLVIKRRFGTLCRYHIQEPGSIDPWKWDR